jgi:hypothetical protein
VSEDPLTSYEDLAMLYVIKKLAPDPGTELLGVTLYLAGRPGGPAGVTVTVDWALFLGEAAEVIRGMYLWRLGEYKAVEAAKEESRIRSERTKAGIARRRAAGLPVGRPVGAKDLQRRRRSGYIAREERKRAERAHADRS